MTRNRDGVAAKCAPTSLAAQRAEACRRDPDQVHDEHMDARLAAWLVAWLNSLAEEVDGPVLVLTTGGGHAMLATSVPSAVRVMPVEGLAAGRDSGRGEGGQDGLDQDGAAVDPAQVAAWAAEGFAALVFVRTALHFGQLQLGTLAARVLGVGATLHVLDRVVDEDDDYFADRDAYVARYLRETVCRCGFALIDEAPLAESGLELHRVLRFGRMARRWQVADAASADREQVRALFATVFGHPLTPEMDRWKYAPGRGCGTVALCDGKVVAHYGGMTRRIRLFGREARAIQVCDVMVTMAERGALTRKGPFFLTASTFAEQFLLNHDIGFGYPNRRAMMVAERLGLYRQVGQLVALRWSAVDRRPLLKSRVRPLSGARDAAALDTLWAAMRDECAQWVIGVRDAAHFEVRYLRHPQQLHHCFVVTRRFGGQTEGVFVLRRGEAGEVELLDLLGPRRAFPVLIAQARRMAVRLGGRFLVCWASEPVAAALDGLGAEVLSLDVSIPTSIWGPGPDPETVRGKWWLMGGDTDFR